MIFKEYTYSVLAVSSSEKFVSQLAPMLPENKFGPIHSVKSVGEARRILSERSYDTVFINTPCSDEFGTRLATDIAADSKSGVLLFAKGDVYDEVVAKVGDYGVLVLAKPLSRGLLFQVLNLLYAVQERFRTLEKKAVSLEDKMEEIRIVNHAKWVLIKNMNISEDEAHRIIEKQAMDMRKSKKETALGIIKTYE